MLPKAALQDFVRLLPPIDLPKYRGCVMLTIHTVFTLAAVLSLIKIILALGFGYFLYVDITKLYVGLSIGFLPRSLMQN